MQILNNQKIIQKIKRLAIQIVENNYAAKDIYLIGINNNGYRFASMLFNELQKYDEINFHLGNIKLNPKRPNKDEIVLDIPLTDMKKKSVIIVDDVANTGRTIFYAFKPFMDIIPQKIEVAVLVNRKHKFFPINVDYMGMTLATTLKDNIIVHLEEEHKAEALLE